MVRTRRVALESFDLSGNDWFDGSNQDVSFDSGGYVEFTLPFTINLGGYGGNPVSTVTLWDVGILSLGPPTQAQMNFRQSMLSAPADNSPIPGEGNPGFPGEFFVFDYDPGNSDPITNGFNHSTYSYGLGLSDYDAPYHYSEAVYSAFFSFSSQYQIVLDQNGFSILAEDGGGSATSINGYFIGTQQDEVTGQEVDVPYYPTDFLTYSGTSGADTLTGTDFNDLIHSSAGADTIDGKGGIDLLDYSASANGVTVNLLLGTGSGGDAQGDHISGIEDINGTGFADNITGSGSANKLQGFDGNDTIAGAGGNDIIVGGNGADTILGNNGNDTLEGDAGNDNLQGGGANDTVEGGAGADTLDGGTGYDILAYTASPAAVTVSMQDSTASGGDATGDTFVNFEGVSGSAFDDLLLASTAGSTLNGIGGNDVLLGSSGVDKIHGGDGDDYMVGGAGADRLDGGLGTDTVSYADSPSALTIDLGPRTASGGDANGDVIISVESVIGTGFADTITGGVGDNRFDAGAGDDTVHGRDGNDTVLGGAGADSLYGENGNDTVTGGSGNDAIYGGAGFDTLAGDDGNDVIDGETGADSMTGGAGDDTYYVDNPGDIVSEAADEGTADHILTTVSYTLGPSSFVETLEISGTTASAPLNLTGNTYANTLIGNTVANILNGAAGDDELFGRGGNDQLHGRSGHDVLHGGLGADDFWFEVQPNAANADTIADFSSADDTIDLASSIYTAIAPGTLAASAFVAGTSAHDADDRIIYDSTTGNIYYDADGSGSGAKALIATLTAGTALTAADFHIG